MKYALALMLLIGASSTFAETKVYRWVDEKGVEHFADKPIPGVMAKEVDIQTFQGNVFNVPKATPSRVPKDKKNKPTADKKTKFAAEIVSPMDDAAIRSNDGSIEISVKIEPGMKVGQSLQLLVDGKPLGKKHKLTSIRATNIHRGTHSLQVQLINKDGKVIASTSTIKVHVLRASVG